MIDTDTTDDVKEPEEDMAARIVPASRVARPIDHVNCKSIFKTHRKQKACEC